MAPIVAATPWSEQATSCWRNSACGLYIQTISSTPVTRGLRKSPWRFGLLFNASMVPSLYSRALTTICEVPARPPVPAGTTVRQGNGGLLSANYHTYVPSEGMIMQIQPKNLWGG